MSGVHTGPTGILPVGARGTRADFIGERASCPFGGTHWDNGRLARWECWRAGYLMPLSAQNGQAARSPRLCGVERARCPFPYDRRGPEGSRRSFLCGAAAFGATSLLRLAGAAAESGAWLKVGVLSDIHVSGPGTESWFVKALEYYRGQDFHLPDLAANRRRGRCVFAAVELPLKGRYRFSVRPLECFGKKGREISTVARI